MAEARRTLREELVGAGDVAGLPLPMGKCEAVDVAGELGPRALRRLGYSDAQVAAIIAYIDEHKSIIGAPSFNPEHLPVFACSMGDNTIHYRGHIRMMAAAQARPSSLS